MTTDRFKAEQDAAREHYELRADVASAMCYADRYASKWSKACDELDTTREHAFKMEAELKKARAELEAADEKARAERSYADELEATLGRIRADVDTMLTTNTDLEAHLGEIREQRNSARAELEAARAELLEARNRVGEVALERDQLAEHATTLIYAKTEIIQERDRLLAANRSLAAELGKLRAETAGA